MLLTTLVSLLESQTRAHIGCSIDVSVRDSKGQPVRASLTLTGTDLASRSADTNGTGQGSFGDLPEDDYRLVVRRANGQRMEEAISTRNGACVQSTMVMLRGSNERAADSVIFVGDLKVPYKAQRLYKDGLSEIKRQRWRDAERLLERSVSVYPEFAAAYNALGVAATEDGNFTVADSAFRRAIRIRANYSEAYLNFAISLDRQKKFSESEVLLNNLLTFEEDTRVAITVLAKVLFDQQKFEDVVNLAHEVHLKQRAHDPALHRYASEIYTLRGMKPESAKEAALMAVESRDRR